LLTGVVSAVRAVSFEQFMRRHLEICGAEDFQQILLVPPGLQTLVLYTE